MEKTEMNVTYAMGYGRAYQKAIKAIYDHADKAAKFDFSEKLLREHYKLIGSKEEMVHTFGLRAAEVEEILEREDAYAVDEYGKAMRDGELDAIQFGWHVAFGDNIDMNYVKSMMNIMAADDGTRK